MKHAADEFMHEITMRRGADGMFYIADEFLPALSVPAQDLADMRLKLAPLLASCAGIEDFKIKLKSAPLVHHLEPRRPRRSDGD